MSGLPIIRLMFLGKYLIAGILLCWSPPLHAADSMRPKPRPATMAKAQVIPAARWDFRPDGEEFTRAALSALRAHGAPLAEIEPADIGQWCPGYNGADAATRRAFWVGFLSALAKHESTWRPTAVGGGGKWYGLLQILPSTARLYDCKARSGAALKSGPANLSCAIRIMARTVTRDGVIHARTPRWSGVSADWGPMRSPAKRQEMANWLRGQDYCQMQVSPRPVPRPTPEGLVMGPRRAPIRPEHRPPVIRLVGAEPRGDFETSDLANRSMDGPGPAVRVD